MSDSQSLKTEVRIDVKGEGKIEQKSETQSKQLSNKTLKKRGRMNLNLTIFNKNDHWTNSYLASKLVEVLANYGVYKPPIETGMKAKIKKQLRDASNIDNNDQLIFETDQLIRQKQNQMKNRIKDLVKYAQETYKLQGDREFFFIKQKDDHQPQFQIDNEGNLLPCETKPILAEFQVDPKLPQKYNNIAKQLNKILYILQKEFAENLQSLFTTFCVLHSMNIEKTFIIDRWMDHLNENKEFFKEIIAFQFVKEGFKEQLNDLEKLQSEPNSFVNQYDCLQKENFMFGMKKCKQSAKGCVKQAKIIKQQINEDLIAEAELISQDNSLIKEFFEAIYDAFNIDEKI